MSKRFGRNQKRALRERAAFLESLNAQIITDKHKAVDDLKLEVDQLKVRLKKMRQFHDEAVAETKRIAQEVEEVCYNSAILPAKYERTPGLPIRRRFPVRRPMVFTRTVALDFENVLQVVEVDLEEVRAALEQDPMNFRQIVHLWAGPKAAARSEWFDWRLRGRSQGR